MSLLLRILLIVVLTRPLFAQEQCGFGGDNNFANTQRLLQQAGTCKQAARELQECAWGSSADNMFASIVVSKCEPDFRPMLSTAAAERYTQEMRLCDLRYTRHGGTMSISAAALCKAKTAERYATAPTIWLDQPLHASFACSLAESKVERAICADGSLGQADVLLSRVYLESVRQPKFQFAEVLQNDQRTWLQALPKDCEHSKLDQANFAKCLQQRFEERYSLIDICAEGAMNEEAWTRSQYLACLGDKRNLQQ